MSAIITLGDISLSVPEMARRARRQGISNASILTFPHPLEITSAYRVVQPINMKTNKVTRCSTTREDGSFRHNSYTVKYGSNITRPVCCADCSNTSKFVADWFEKDDRNEWVCDICQLYRKARDEECLLLAPGVEEPHELHLAALSARLLGENRWRRELRAERKAPPVCPALPLPGALQGPPCVFATIRANPSPGATVSCPAVPRASLCTYN